MRLRELLQKERIQIDEKVKFRRLATPDLPLMHRWLSQPYLVDLWLYGKPFQFEDVVRKYKPRIDGVEPTEPFLILWEDSPIGYIQSYLWKDYPEATTLFNAREESAAGLDVFIGEEGLLGRGIGVSVLTAFLRDVVFARYEVSQCVITPLVNNPRAIRAYRKAGFREVRVIEPPNEPAPVQLMAVTRDEALNADSKQGDRAAARPSSMTTEHEDRLAD